MLKVQPVRAQPASRVTGGYAVSERGVSTGEYAASESVIWCESVGVSVA